MNFEETKFVHFGHPDFSKDMISRRSATTRYAEVINCKPNGLWASPKLDKLEGYQTDWSDWCSVKGYDIEKLDIGFSFGITKDANIFYINHPNDIVPYVLNMDDYKNAKEAISCFRLLVHTPVIDFEKIYSEYDGMYVPYHEKLSIFNMTIFDTYDVDSLCVWNPDIIQNIRYFRQDFDKFMC